MRDSAVLEHIVKDFCRDDNIDDYIARVFNFNYSMPQPHKSQFERLFYLRYRYYQINYESFSMFQNYLESKINELLPKYSKLYASENCILNPFLNYIVREDSFNRRRSRTKDYSTFAGNQLGHSTDRNGGVDVSHSINSAMQNNANMQRRDSIAKDKETSDNNQKETHLFSDTPQSKFDENNKMFNNGYVTTVNSDHIRDAHIKSGVNQGFEQTGTQGSSDSSGSADVYSDTIREGEARSYGQQYTENENVSALHDTIKNAIEKEGLTGVTVSQVVNEWRTTFINIDKMFLDELRDLFMLVY